MQPIIQGVIERHRAAADVMVAGLHTLACAHDDQPEAVAITKLGQELAEILNHDADSIAEVLAALAIRTERSPWRKLARLLGIN